jgi:hypothetical protein
MGCCGERLECRAAAQLTSQQAKKWYVEGDIYRADRGQVEFNSFF